MSDVKTIEFKVEQKVLDIGVKIVFPVIEGIDNTSIDPEWFHIREEKIQELLEKYKDIEYHADPILEGFHILHDKAGVKRRKNVPASENLIRLLKKKRDIIFINPVVDIYNLISLETKLALGAHDIDRVDGNVSLRFTDGTENFLPLGQSEPSPSPRGEYSYCDDGNDILCRLEIRQVQKTAVDENSKNVFYIVQGNAATSDDYLISAAKDIIDLTTKYCGGKGHIVIPDVIE
ncbi:MAG: hypothetical protein J6E46_01580 [Faecalicoccus sp.]|nr:hypothetical protein [Faecalicoccus sp.]